MSTHVAAQPPKRVQKLKGKPWKAQARASRAVRKHLDAQDHVTPHFTWAEFACQDAQKTPVPPNLRTNTIRLCWLLEKLRHQLGDVPISIDLGYRTPAHNRQVGGAADSRHMHGDAADFFVAQVDRWIAHGTAGGPNRRARGREPHLRQRGRRQRDLGHPARRCPRLDGALHHLGRGEVTLGQARHG